MSAKHLFIFVCLSCSFSSCKELKNLINKKFPPLTIIDQQYSSTEQSLKELGNLKPDVGVNIDKDLITEYLPEEIKKAAMAAKDEDIILKKLSPSLSFDKQGIFISADFILELPKSKAEVRGCFKGVTTPSNANDSLYLRSAFSSLTIDTIEFSEKPSLSDQTLADLIAPVLKHFLNNINGEIFKKPTRIYIGWGEIYSFRLKEMFTDPKTKVEAQSIRISRFAKKTCMRVRTNGISLLIELTENKPDQKPPAPITTQKLGRTETDLNKIFKTFDKKFDSCWVNVFESIDPKSLISLHISKSEIADILNAILSKPISLNHDFEIAVSKFNENLEVKSGNISCEKARKKFKYDRYKKDKCDHGCKWWNEPCKAGEKLCEGKEKMKVDADNFKRESAKVIHDLQNEKRVADCRLWKLTAEFLALGRFKGKVGGSGKANFDFKYFHFNPDLSEITLKCSGKIEAKIKAEIELKPVDIGYAFYCWGDFEKNISSPITIGIPKTTEKLNISAHRKKDTLILKIKPEKIKYNASTSNSPLHQLLKDPKFLAQCPISRLMLFGGTTAAIGKLLGLVKLTTEQELLLFGKAKGEYVPDKIEIPLKPVTFKINGEKKESSLFWDKKSIQAKYLRPKNKITSPD